MRLYEAGSLVVEAWPRGRWIHEEGKCENRRAGRRRQRAGGPLRVAPGRQINCHLGHHPRRIS